jgi:hypothetical protein
MLVIGAVTLTKKLLPRLQSRIREPEIAAAA